jgi:hypothetical protein
MISEFATARELPEEARKLYRQFLFGFCFSVAFMAILYAFLFYRHIVGREVTTGVVSIAFVGLLMIMMVGVSAAKCIRLVALVAKRALERNGGER